MNKPQVIVEVMGINWGDSTFGECADQLVFFWVNERGLPYIEHIKRMQAKAWMNFTPIVSCHPKE